MRGYLHSRGRPRQSGQYMGLLVRQGVLYFFSYVHVSPRSISPHDDRFPPQLLSVRSDGRWVISKFFRSADDSRLFDSFWDVAPRFILGVRALHARDLLARRGSWIDSRFGSSSSRGAAGTAIIFRNIQQDEGVGEREKIKVGVAQTAYANGSSTRYLSARLPVTCVPTGVKHLHHAAAERYDIGVYFEANGHGTVLFSSSAQRKIASHRPSTPAHAVALERLKDVIDVINQTVGDALSDMLLVEVALHHMSYSVETWDKLYSDGTPDAWNFFVHGSLLSVSLT